MGKSHKRNNINRNRNRNTGNVSDNSTAKFTEKGNRKQGRQLSTLGTPYREPLTRGNSTRNERRGAEAADTAAKMSESNPVGFYTKFSTFSRDAANLPFAQPLGVRFNVSNGIDGNYHQYGVPGIMRIQFTPAIGISDDFTSPINRSSIRFYTYLRSNQKASALYDHQDITLMEISLDSCYMFHALLTKIYGVMNLFTPLNEYYPRAIIAAYGASFDDVKANLQDLRAYINTFAYNLGQYALPKDITLFDRHRWMLEGLYTDSTSTRAQTYCFVPNGFWQYLNTGENGGQCTWKEYLPSGSIAKQYTVAELMQFGNELLNAVSNEEDFAIISGDIYNFYGGDTYKLPYVDENYTILPTYDKTVLSQIENLTLVGNLDAASLVIKQDASVNKGALLFQPTHLQTMMSTVHTFMNFHWDSPTPDDVIEASRLMTIIENGSKGGRVKACGTEIVVQLDVFSVNPATGKFRFNPIIDPEFMLATEYSDMISQMQDVIHLMQFDWAPTIRIWDSPSTGGHDFMGFTWDVDNIQQIQDQYIEQIHLASLYSLFEVGTNRE